jgi:hypothetical protein
MMLAFSNSDICQQQGGDLGYLAKSNGETI